MSVQLDQGFRAKIEIRNSEDNNIFEKAYFSPGEVEFFFKTYAKSKPGWSMIRGAICPLRTNNPKNFSKDLFLPTFVNFALKVNNVALKLFAAIFAIAFDIITFPVRLVVTPFRVIYNHLNPEKKHPLFSLIEDADKDGCNIGDVVTIHYKVEDVSMSDPVQEDGHRVQNARKYLAEGTIQIALKRLPGGIKSQVAGETESSTYIGMDGEWTREGYFKAEMKQLSFAC